MSEHSLPSCMGVPDTLSLSDKNLFICPHPGRGDAHLGGEPGVLVAPWAIAKDPSGLSQEF